MRRHHCATCATSLTPGDRLCAYTYCFACRVLARAAAHISPKHKRPVTETEQEQHTRAVRSMGRQKYA